jgi:hypothetical protein
MRRASVTAALVVLMIAFLPGGTGDALVGGSLLFPPSEGRFTSQCGYSHRLHDDPIVKPAQPGASHSHDFFGNMTTNAFSSYVSLRAGGTTCARAQDAAGYWVPTLYDAGVAVRPTGMNAYYTGRGKSALTIKPFPAGLRIVAGNANATGPQPMMVAEWSCGENSSTESSGVPLCAFASLRLHVRFPDCWDGVNLDSADHRSHMQYSSYGRCPNGFTTAVPGLQINVSYPVRGGPTVTLASGSPYTAHGDFFNAWNQAELTSLVRECLNIRQNCG